MSFFYDLEGILLQSQTCFTGFYVVIQKHHWFLSSGWLALIGPDVESRPVWHLCSVVSPQLNSQRTTVDTCTQLTSGRI